MKALVCELCNSNDFLKQDGVFVCQYCGTKYTLEEARKLMIDGVVQVQGVVRIDTAGEVEKLLQAARNARETGDDESAIRHYERVSAMEPDNWEALFYLVVLRTNEITNGQIRSAAIGVSNCLPKIFELINEKLADVNEKKAAVWEVVQQCEETAQWLTSASHNYYKTSTKGDGLMALTGLFGAISSANSVVTSLNEDNERCVAAANIMFCCGNYISAVFDMNDEDFSGFAVWSWKQTLDFHTDYRQVHKTQTLFDEDSVQRLTAYINQYAPNMLGAIREEGAPDQVVLTVAYDSNAGGAGQLWYAIDYGEKNTLNRLETKPHFLPCGNHTISVLNPFMKRDYTFYLDQSKTINIYGKSFGMDIT